VAHALFFRDTPANLSGYALGSAKVSGGTRNY